MLKDIEPLIKQFVILGPKFSAKVFVVVQKLGGSGRADNQKDCKFLHFEIN